MRSNGLLLKDYTVLVVNTHLTGDLKLVADQIGEWARLQTPIVRLWLFGGRARRTQSPDRALDVAIEVESLPTNDARDAFDILRESWTTELSAATGLEIHFERAQITVVHSDDLRAGIDGRIQFIGLMDFDQGRHPVRRRQFAHLTAE